MQLKITSLNLGGFTSWNERLPKIVAFLGTEQPDVLLLQEARFDPDESPYNQAELLNRALTSPYTYTHVCIDRYYKPSAGKAYREGMAALSKYPITNSEVLALTKHPDDKHFRVMQNINLLADDGTIHITNVHLSNNVHSKEQLSELLAIMRSRGESRIIAGDFNVFDILEFRDFFAESYIASTEYKKYVSFPAEGNTFDYVLLPKQYTYKSLHLTEELSDHAALTTTVGIKTGT